MKCSPAAVRKIVSFLPLLSLYKFCTRVISTKQLLEQFQNEDDTTYIVLIECNKFFVQHFSTKILPLLENSKGMLRLFEGRLQLKLENLFFHQKNCKLITPQVMTRLVSKWKWQSLELPMCDLLGWHSQHAKSEMSWIQTCCKTQNNFLLELHLPGCNINDAMLMNNSHFENGIAHLQKVKKLNLAYNMWIGDYGMESMMNATLANLESLDLSFTKITDKSLRSINKMKKLKQLLLCNTEVSSKGLQQLELFDLKELNLLECRLSSTTFLNSFKKLEKLAISCKYLHSLPDACKHIGSLMQLKELLLIGFEEWNQTLSQLCFSNLSQCKILSLRGRKMRQTEQVLVQLSSLTSLRVLDFCLETIEISEDLLVQFQILLQKLDHFYCVCENWKGETHLAYKMLPTSQCDITLFSCNLPLPWDKLVDFINCCGKLQDLCVTILEPSMIDCYINTQNTNIWKQLKSVELDFHTNSQAIFETLSSYLTNSNSLQKLTLKNASHWNDSQFELLISQTSNLKSLHLHHCNSISETCLQSLITKHYLNQLQFLKISGNTQLSIKAFLPCNNMNQLVMLELPSTMKDAIKLDKLLKHVTVNLSQE